MTITKGSKMVELKAGCPSTAVASACLATFLPHTHTHTMQR
ncbi:hypothetical protein [Candidatus Magnetobacterium casense]|nr:hypothetical protein [Candidatus Magnetobacterium casensis]